MKNLLLKKKITPLIEFIIVIILIFAYY